MDYFYKKFVKDFKRSPKVSLTNLLEQISIAPNSFALNWPEISKQISAHQFLSHFFNLQNSSEEILTFFYQNDMELLIKVIGEKKSFLKPSHFQIISKLFKDDNSFITEILFWKNIWEEMYNIISSNTFLAKHDFEDVLILCGLYYETLKITLGRNYRQDEDFIEIINEILSNKIVQMKKEGKEITVSKDNTVFNEKVVDLLLGLIENGDAELTSIFTLYKAFVDLKFCYDNYLVQGFKISIQGNYTATIKPDSEKKYLQYKRTGYKYLCVQMLLHERAFEELDKEIDEIENAAISLGDKIFHKAVLAQIYQYIDAGFPEFIFIKHKKFLLDPKVCLRVINVIGKISNDRWNNAVEIQIINGNSDNPYSIQLNIIRDYYKQYKSITLPVVMDNIEIFGEIVEEIIKVDKGCGENSIALFATDIDQARNSRLSLQSKPFIKVGGNVYWISGILSNRNYSVMLQNIILQTDIQKDTNGITSQYGKNAEEELAFRFELNEYTVIPNYKYSYKNGGEIDVLAYKEHTLFICQVKSTFHRASVREISEHFSNTQTGIKKAIEQLNKDIDFVQNNWREIQERLGITIDYVNVKIVPLAVTTTLEDNIGDIIIKGYKSYIVPLIDMRIILSNWKRYLFMNYLEIALNDKYQNNIPKEIKEVMSGLREDEAISKQMADITVQYIEKNKNKVHHNLWNDGKSLCSPADLLNALENDLVWDFLEHKNTLLIKPIVIGRYTLNSLE